MPRARKLNDRSGDFYYALDAWHDQGVYVPTRTIYLSDSEGSAVDANAASRVIKNLHLLSAMSKDAITIVVNTVGGDVHAGLAIFDAMHESECHITARVIGAAMSMGAVIIQAADEREMHPNATLMLHDGSMGMDDHARNVEAWAEWCKAARFQMYSIFAQRTGRSLRYWETRCNTDMILDATKALKERLIDRIFTRE